MKYSNALVDRYISHMRSARNVCVSPEQAQLDLASLSSLYLAFFSSTLGSGASGELPARPHHTVGRAGR